jgi:hypothetical protein
VGWTANPTTINRTNTKSLIGIINNIHNQYKNNVLKQF